MGQRLDPAVRVWRTLSPCNPRSSYDLADGKVNIEPDQGDASQQRYLWWKPMAWLGIIRPTNQSEKWHMQQWSTFFCLTLGLPMPWISPGTRCACQKFFHDQYANHALTCNTHGGAAKSHDWAVAQVAALFRSLGNNVRTQTRVTGVGPNRKQRGDIEGSTRSRFPRPALPLPGCPQNPPGPYLGQGGGHACYDQCYGLPCPGTGS